MRFPAQPGSCASAFHLHSSCEYSYEYSRDSHSQFIRKAAPTGPTGGIPPIDGRNVPMQVPWTATYECELVHISRKR
jgi:hypothetical protein